MTRSPSFDEWSDSNMSNMSGCNDESPPQRKKKYRKDELWAAIQSDYHYLMDEGIIETCRSTESDLSWESDECSNHKVSFTEFVQQYKELTDWLTQIQQVTQRQSSSLSEKYLNQAYQEEMLQRSPRHKLFNDYAKQLMRRYPSMKEEIIQRLQFVNTQWQALESIISPAHRLVDQNLVLKDLEEDLTELRKWLHGVETQLDPMSMRDNSDIEDLQGKLKEHQELQRDIESHSRIVSAVLKLCDHVRKTQPDCEAVEGQRLVAVNLERRWHAVWLQSLEWQCRLEDAIKSGKGLVSKRYSNEWSDFSFISPGHEGEQWFEEDELSGSFSDNSDSSDVIPFRSRDYEKITVDTQTDDGKVTPCSSGGENSSCLEDPGIDSALGRSVSDQSIPEPHLLPAEPENKGPPPKVVTFSGKVEMRSIPEQSPSPEVGKMADQPVDVGYSSENQSNDEGEDLNTTVKLRRHAVSSESVESKSSPDEGPDKTWRHSMTSAYDTSSNCSERCVLDLDGTLEGSLDNTLDTVDTTVQEEDFEDSAPYIPAEKVQVIMSSPSKPFYVMTQVNLETDSDFTCPTASDVGSRPTSTPLKSSARKQLCLFDSRDASGESVGSGSDSDESSCYSDTQSDPLFSTSFTSRKRKLRSRKRARPSSLNDLSTFDRPIGSSALSLSDGAIHELQQRGMGTKRQRRLRKTASMGQAPQPALDSRSLISSGNLTSFYSAKDSVEQIGSFEIGRTSSPNAGEDARLVLSTEGPVLDSGDDTDAAAKVMNSTLESLENAWDYYQEPRYTSISDDPNEEKLDDSILPWPDTLEFEEDFDLDHTFGAKCPPAPVGFKPSAMRDFTDESDSDEEELQFKHKSRRFLSKMAADNSHVDSDSDLEDLHHVIQESSQQISVTENSLKKKRKDPMDTGISFDQSKYAELLATCQTNIKCLDVIIDTLEAGENLPNVTQDDLQKVKDLIEQWEVLENLAGKRQMQSRQLGGLYHHLNRLKSSVISLSEDLNLVACRNLPHLEAIIKIIQDKRMELENEKPKLAKLCTEIKNINQPSIGKFQSEVQAVNKSYQNLMNRSSTAIGELHGVMMCWYEMNETYQELAYMLQQERKQLQIMDLARDVVPMASKDIHTTIADLKMMQKEFGVYEGKLQLLRQQMAQILPICDTMAQLDLRTMMAQADSDLSAVQRKNAELLTIMEDRLTNLLASQALHGSSEGREGQRRRSTWRRLVDMAVPIQVAVLMALGLLYLIGPDDIADMSLSITPELRYVRGPPPT